MATLSITEEEASMPKNPDLELAQKRFLLTLNDEIVPPEEKQTIDTEVDGATKAGLEARKVVDSGGDLPSTVPFYSGVRAEHQATSSTATLLR